MGWLSRLRFDLLGDSECASALMPDCHASSLRNNLRQAHVPRSILQARHVLTKVFSLTLQHLSLVYMFRYFAFLRLSFSAWESFQLHQQRKRQHREQLMVAHKFRTCKKAWMAWRRDFLPWARQKRSDHARAVSHWRSNVLARTMCSWVEVLNT